MDCGCYSRSQFTYSLYIAYILQRASSAPWPCVRSGRLRLELHYIGRRLPALGHSAIKTGQAEAVETALLRSLSLSLAVLSSLTCPVIDIFPSEPRHTQHTHTQFSVMFTIN